MLQVKSTLEVQQEGEEFPLQSWKGQVDPKMVHAMHVCIKSCCSLCFFKNLIVFHITFLLSSQANFTCLQFFHLTVAINDENEEKRSSIQPIMPAGIVIYHFSVKTFDS